MGLEKILSESINRCELETKGKCNDRINAYPFTTECIANYIDLFDLKDKSLLTVGSSGDQVINAIIKGCKDITLLDLVEDTRYYYYLKCAGLLILTKEEFLEFFRYESYITLYRDNLNVFNKQSWNKIKDTLRVLDYESYLYYDKLFNLFGPILIRKALFIEDEGINECVNDENLYLRSNITYEEAKQKIKSVRPKFICQDIFDLDGSIKYDNIWLSNIITYIESYERFPILVETAYNSLSEEGKLLAAYIYDIEQYKGDYTSRYINLLKIFSLIKDFNYKVEAFDAINYCGVKHTDGIIVVNKR